ncbi:MAG TPA: 50S ribosomal protein L4 [Phycisphaeraceae bacterium]|nr:50S ribosomal protein L4 [Phycisphaeraceae bacterium]
MKIPVYDKQGKEIDSLEVQEHLLGGEIRPALLKQAYVYYHANQRQGSARTRSRGDVDGSGKKLYRQKGTGRARMGRRRTVIRKGGGVAFAKTKTKEAYRLNMNRKQRRLANRNAMLAKLVDGEVKLLDDLSFDTPSTKPLKAVLDSLGIDRTCLLALDEGNRNAALSARNLAGVTTCIDRQLNTFQMLNHRYLVVTRDSFLSWLNGPSSQTGKIVGVPMGSTRNQEAD